RAQRRAAPAAAARGGRDDRGRLCRDRPRNPRDLRPGGDRMSAGDPTGGQREPTEQEMRAALEEELKRVRVEQVVTEATVSILNVAVLRAGLVPGSEGERDLAQTRIGIEAVRALLPLVEQALGAEQARPIR